VSETKPVCQQCGSPVVDGALFCSRCGVDVTAPHTPDDATVPMTAVGAPAPRVKSTMRQMLRDATLGEYEILSELGRGGMATVFLAHDISLDRKVAIKVMAPHLLEGEGMAERFKLEARTAAQLSHPHIIPIYAVRETESALFFVMKYVEGRTLDEIIKRMGQLPIPMVKDILTKVGSALGYAHRRNVIHRDVKPGNIMIDEEGTPIVADFGIAKVAETKGLTMTGTTIGTPSYMSPEQCEAREVTGDGRCAGHRAARGAWLHHRGLRALASGRGARPTPVAAGVRCDAPRRGHSARGRDGAAGQRAGRDEPQGPGPDCRNRCRGTPAGRVHRR
jgi:serine/threonine-protein kinase